MATTSKELLTMSAEEQNRLLSANQLSDDELITYICEVQDEALKQLAASQLSSHNEIRNQGIIPRQQASDQEELQSEPKVTFPLLTFCKTIFTILAICSGIGILAYITTYFSQTAEFDPDAHLALVKAMYSFMCLLSSIVIISIMDWLKRIGYHILSKN